jgi:lactoylglutathione lyase
MSETGKAAPRVLGLFEAHLPVSDVGRATAFYRDVVGLELAYETPERDAAFLWSGGRGTSMVGLWSQGGAPMSLQLHLAFAISLADVLDAPSRLRALGVQPLSFFGASAEEASVIGWMPAAAVYFRDPDAHLLEYIAMLDGRPHPEAGITTWEHWRHIDGHAQSPLSVPSAANATMGS